MELQQPDRSRIQTGSGCLSVSAATGVIMSVHASAGWFSEVRGQASRPPNTGAGKKEKKPNTLTHVVQILPKVLFKTNIH